MNIKNITGLALRVVIGVAAFSLFKETPALAVAAMGAANSIPTGFAEGLATIGGNLISDRIAKGTDLKALENSRKINRHLARAYLLCAAKGADESDLNDADKNHISGLLKSAARDPKKIDLAFKQAFDNWENHKKDDQTNFGQFLATASTDPEAIADSLCAYISEYLKKPCGTDLEPGEQANLKEHIGQAILDHFAEFLLEDDDAREKFYIYSLQVHSVLAADTNSEVHQLADALRPLLASQEEFVKLLKDHRDQVLKLDAAIDNIQGISDYFQRVQEPPIRMPGEYLASSRFIYYADTVRFTGRQKELEELEDFLDGDVSLKWKALTGPAGSGKSRTGYHLCKLFKDKDWEVGFLGGTEQDTFNWRTWVPKRKTLIVVDYALRRSKAVGNLLYGLLQRKYHVPVRVLMLAREPSKDLFDQLLRQACPEGCSDQLHGLVNAPIRDDLLELGPMNEGELTEVMRSYLQRENKSIPADETLNELAVKVCELGKDHAQGRTEVQTARPLFALFAADAVGSGVGITNWSVEALTQGIWDQEVRHWDQGRLPEAYRHLLLVATICGEIAPGRLHQELPQAYWDENHLNLVRGLTERHENQMILGAIQPDIIGEYYVLQRLLGEYRESRITKDNVIEASKALSQWAVDQNQKEAVDFLTRTVQNFPDHAAVPFVRSLLPEDIDPLQAALLAYAVAQDKGTKAAEEFIQTENWGPVAKATSLFGLTTLEPDPKERMKIAREIEALHTKYGNEPAVRELLAMALHNATAVEPDPKERMKIAGEIEALHKQYGNESAVREWLAMALHNATVVEPDPKERMKIAREIEALHTKYDNEPSVREALAKALTNATAGEPDPKECMKIAREIEALHTQYGNEPAVRELLAKALYNATVVEPDPKESLKVAREIEALHTKYGNEPAVRELLAMALTNATAVEPDPKECMKIAREIEALHTQYGNEPAVRELLAKALYNATVVEPDPKESMKIAREIEALHTQYGNEPAVREALAKALFNATVVEPDPKERMKLAREIEALHKQYGNEPAVRELLAMALHNATVVEPDPKERMKIAREIEALHTQYGNEPAVREALAMALHNATAVEPDPKECLKIAREIEALHTQYGNEPAVREQLAKALTIAGLRFIATGDRAKGLALLRESYGLFDPCLPVIGETLERAPEIQFISQGEYEFIKGGPEPLAN